MNRGTDAFECGIEAGWINSENATLTDIPGYLAGRELPVPGAHLAGFECHAPPPLALDEVGCRSLKLSRAFGDAQFEFTIERFQRARLAIKFRKDIYFRAQNFGNDGYWHVVNGADLVPPQPVIFGKMNRRDEYDSGLLKARMLTDHRSEFEPVQIRHTNVDQDDGNLVPQQAFEGFPRRGRLDQVLVQLGENDFITDQLCRLIVHQQDVDFFVVIHVPPHR